VGSGFYGEAPYEGCSIYFMCRLHQSRT
jgi:hypothetical protein